MYAWGSFQTFTPMSIDRDLYADILLPLALEKTYTYRIPPNLAGKAEFGKRVEVQFGSRKRYAGLIVKISNSPPGYKTKEIISILDPTPLLYPWQYSFWQWLAEYYCCTEGEIMKAALPGALLLSSETVIRIMPVSEDEILQLGDPLYSIINLVRQKDSITLDELEKNSGLKILYPHIVRLYQLGMITVHEELEEKYIPKKIQLVQLAPEFKTDEGLHKAFDLLAGKEKQTEMLLSYLSAAGAEKNNVEPSELLGRTGSSPSVLQSLIKKGILKKTYRLVNRTDLYHKAMDADTYELTHVQQEILDGIRDQWLDKEVVLLHGVTGSGKTLIYTSLIHDVINSGGQVLYLVPEIGLSVQILERLKKQFNQNITISHSRLNENERVDLWHRVKSGIPVVAGVRSSIFLPFQNLKLVIIDEEHDTSYKQQDPNPRYHARDSAIYLASQLGAKVLLGSATPSIESSYHTATGKYGRALLKERYLGVEMPEIVIIDKRKDKSVEGSPYSHTLIEAIKSTLKEKNQVIIFKNRRGYSPVLKCSVCQWVAECHQCDISLTFHKGKNRLICHVCGTSKPLVTICPACGSPRLNLEGYGTEKIEDELMMIFPEARIRRMDLDTTRGKHNLEKLIHDFEAGKIDILVGTQMVTKGLDFDRVGLVGVIYADQALHYPDFRAAERLFQTLVQVSGRAGRKEAKGKVMIQTFQPDHLVFRDVVKNDYASFYSREIRERKMFGYPPFVRQIALTVKHQNAEICREASEILALDLKELFGPRILGPSTPAVSRIRNQHLQMIHIKMEKDQKLIHEVKAALKSFQTGIIKRKSLSTVRIAIDVDPYF